MVIGHALVTRFALTRLIALVLVPLSALAAVLPAAQHTVPFTPPALPASLPALTALPVAFRAAAPRAHFQANALGGTVHFAPNGLALILPDPTAAERAAVRAVAMRFADASPGTTLTAVEQLPGVVNDLRGSDPARWVVGAPTYGALLYQQLYPGIDLRYDGRGQQLKGTFTVAPGADPASIRWGYQGASQVRINQATGALEVIVARGASGTPLLLTEDAPVAWQDIGAARRPVPVWFTLDAGGQVGFVVGAYDPAHPLVIDPTITYGTYVGGGENDSAYDVAVDPSGNMYLIGRTVSRNFPTVNASQTIYAGGVNGDTFVTKINAAGTAILYSTFLGGSSDDLGYGVAVDAAGNAYVVGTTSSSNFPIASAVQPQCAGFGICTSDAFITKLSPEGGLVFSTYLGGTGSEYGDSIAVDATGVYITGITSSVSFPTTQGALRTGANFPLNGGSTDVFVTKLALDGSALVYSTYLGGTAEDGLLSSRVSLAVTGGRAHIHGSTRSTDFPLVNPTQVQNGGDDDPGGGGDGFVAILNETGSALLFSTYLGGRGDENTFVTGIAVDAAGNIIVTGETDSPNFPVQNALQPTFASTEQIFTDAYVVKYSPLGGQVLFATYLGGTSIDDGADVAVDGQGNIYVTGKAGRGFALARPFAAGQGACQPGICGFLAKLPPGGERLLYATYLASRFGNDYARALVVSAEGVAYVAGSTNSRTLPVPGGVQQQSGGGSDAFVIKVSDDGGGTAPVIAPINGQLGAPGSFFGFSGINLPPNSALALRVNDRPVTTVGVPATGSLLFTLYFLTGTPPGTYRVSLAPATAGPATMAVLAETTITIDPAAPVLENPGTGAVITGSLATYLPWARR